MKKRILIFTAVVVFILAIAGGYAFPRILLGARTGIPGVWKAVVSGILQPINITNDVAIPGSGGGIATNTASLYCDVSEDTCYMQNAEIGIILSPILESPLLIPSADGTATTTLSTANTTGVFKIDTEGAIGINNDTWFRADSFDGSNTVNCNFAIFSSKENTKAWEQSKKDGKEQP